MTDDDRKKLDEIEARVRLNKPRLYAYNGLTIEDVADFEWIIATLKAERGKTEEARIYADRLAINIKLKHFADVAPDWQPLPDVLGILTQIDNMVAGIGEHKARLTTLPTHWWNGTQWVLDYTPAAIEEPQP